MSSLSDVSKKSKIQEMLRHSKILDFCKDRKKVNEKYLDLMNTLYAYIHCIHS